MKPPMEPKDLRKAGLKATTPRLRILQMLDEGGTRQRVGVVRP